MDTERLLKRVRREYTWSEGMAAERVKEYERFMELKAAAKDWNAELLSPSPLVDLVWHAHALDTRRYPAECRSAFKRVIHHDPDGGEDRAARQKRYEATLRRYKRRFKAEPPPAVWPKAYPSFSDEGFAVEVRKMSSPHSTYCYASLSATVEELKREIEQAYSIPVSQQRLIFKGTALVDEKTLGSYGIRADDNRVHLVAAVSGC